MKLISCIEKKKTSYEHLLVDFNNDFKKLNKIIGLIGNEVRLKLMWLINEDKFLFAFRNTYNEELSSLLEGAKGCVVQALFNN